MKHSNGTPADKIKPPHKHIVALDGLAVVLRQDEQRRRERSAERSASASASARRVTGFRSKSRSRKCRPSRPTRPQSPRPECSGGRKD